MLSVCVCVCGCLSGPTEIPRYREIGVAIPLSQCVSWHRRLSLLQPHFLQ